MSTRNILIGLLIALSLFGLVNAVYLTQTALSGAELSCNIDGLDGCNIVAQSPYSLLFGIPIAVYGVAYFFFVFLIGTLLFFYRSRVYYLALCTLSVIGVVMSGYFIMVQFALIKAVCVYCLLSALTVLLIAILSYLLYKYSPFSKELS